MIFNIVFFISITSVLIQGTTLPLVARWLHLSLPEKLKYRTQADLGLSDSIKSILTEIVIPTESPVIGKQIVELELPKTTLISIIQRGDQFITPNGSTELAGGDKLYVLSEDDDSLKKVFLCLN